jgi:hypothetical protein
MSSKYQDQWGKEKPQTGHSEVLVTPKRSSHFHSSSALCQERNCVVTERILRRAAITQIKHEEGLTHVTFPMSNYLRV